MTAPGTIGIPCSPLVDSKFLIGFLLMEKPADTAMMVLSGEGVAYQRNAIAQNFQGDWLLFMDSDMIPAPDALTRLLARGDLDIVHAVCSRRTPPYGYCTWDVDGKELARPIRRHGLVEAAGCGMAFTLIRRRVFDAIPFPWFEVGKGEDSTALYEDLWFCRKARAKGFRIWADLGATVWHLTQHAVAPGPDGFPQVIAAAETMPQIRQEDAHATEQSPEPAIAS